MADEAPVFWRPEISPGTVILAPAPEGYAMDGTPAPTAFSSALADRSDKGDRHVVLYDPDGKHRLWLLGDDAMRRPAALLPLDDLLDLRFEAALRLYRHLRGQPTGQLPHALDLTPMRRERLIQLLHVLDYRLTGAKPRTIAATMIDADAAQMSAAEWKSSGLRRKTRHWISQAEALMNGGYRKLLRGEWLPQEDE